MHAAFENLSPEFRQEVFDWYIQQPPEEFNKTGRIVVQGSSGWKSVCCPWGAVLCVLSPQAVDRFDLLPTDGVMVDRTIWTLLIEATVSRHGPDRDRLNAIWHGVSEQATSDFIENFDNEMYNTPEKLAKAMGVVYSESVV